MVTADHDGCLDPAAPNQLIEPQAEGGPFPVAEPADPGRQSLEVDLLPRHPDPAAQRLVLGEHLQHQVVGHGNVRRIA